MSVQIPIIILIAFLYFKGITPNINKITFFIMIIALFKVFLSILIFSKIKYDYIFSGNSWIKHNYLPDS